MLGTHLVGLRKRAGNLPYNRKKSVLGSVSFVVTSLLFSVFFLQYFYNRGLIGVTGNVTYC
jgi:dolichol kinase